jgi:hypothetical protein
MGALAPLVRVALDQPESGPLGPRPGRVRFDADARLERAEAAFDPGAFDPGAFQTKDMIVVPAGGTAWEAMRVANGCVAAWKEFLGKHRLLEDPGGTVD